MDLTPRLQKVALDAAKYAHDKCGGANGWYRMTREMRLEAVTYQAFQMMVRAAKFEKTNFGAEDIILLNSYITLALESVERT